MPAPSSIESPALVLLVEDDASHAALVEDAFAAQQGLQLAVAGSLDEARRILGERRPDLVIADLVLPDGQGSELLAGEDGVPAFPVVVMTSQGNEQLAVESLHAGALDYLVKTPELLGDLPRISRLALGSWRHVLERRAAEQTLLHREAILGALAGATQHLLGDSFTREEIQFVVDSLGLAAEVSRAYVFRNHRDKENRLLTSQLCEWTAEGVEAQIDNPELQNLPFEDVAPRWVSTLGGGDPLSGHVRDFPDPERQILETQAIRSIVVVPIFTGHRWWGFLGLDECRRLREWNPLVIDSLTAAAGVLGAALLRRRREAELRRIKAAVESTSDAIQILNAEEEILYVNPAFERCSGYSSVDVLGGAARSFKSGHQGRGFFGAIGRQLSAGEVWRGRIWNRHREGRRYEVEASVSPVFDRHGKMVNIVSVERDTSKERELEQQLRHALKVESVGRLAGGIAHDFNNLLTPIIGYADLALNRLQPQDGFYDELKQIRSAAERARGLTRQLLAFSREQVLEMRVLDLADLVTGFEQMLRRTIREDIEIELILEPELGRVQADPYQIEQILLNLALNAMDAQPRGGLLRIRALNVEPGALPRPHDEGVVKEPSVLLEVSDRGSGMDERTLERIFDPFFTTKETGKGTGLGLATAYGIVRQHEGRITVESEPGRGSTFRVYLPRVREAPAGEQATEFLGRGPQGTETILVVEDNSLVRSLANRILSRHGYTVVDYGDPRKALADLAGSEWKIDLLLTDVVMPGMNGRQLFEELRERYPALPVIYMSGYVEDEISRQGIEQQDGCFVQKPFTVRALTERVRQALDSAATS